MDNNDEWAETTPCQHLLTVCVAGNTIKMDSNKMSLAPLIQTSHPTNPKAPNHNRFAALDSTVQRSTDVKKSKWVVPPKTDKQI